MANFLKTILSRCGQCGPAAGGIIQSSLGGQKSPLVIANLEISLTKCSTIQSRKSSNFQDYKSAVYSDSKRVLAFEKLYLPSNPDAKIKEGILVNNFQKILKIYKLRKDQPEFKSDFRYFVAGVNFSKFCTVVDRKLPLLSPNSLMAFLDLEHFKSPKTEILLRKIFTLILENFNSFKLIEIVEMYIKLSEIKFRDNAGCLNVMKACEVYFRENFANDLRTSPHTLELLNILTQEIIPESVRKEISMFLLDEAFLHRLNQKQLTSLIFTVTNWAHHLVEKNSLLRLIKKCLYTFQSVGLVENLSDSYKNLVMINESFYDEEIIDQLLASSRRKIFTEYNRLRVIENLCLMGYYNPEFVSYVCDSILSMSPNGVSKPVAFRAANILVQCSFHETEPAKRVTNTRSQFEKIDLQVSSQPELCTWCELLTYMECDTRSLCRQLFKGATLDFKPGLDKNVLTLHHLAKAILSTGYEILPEGRLNSLLLNEFNNINSVSCDSLGPYFGGGEYLLKNCTTSEKHCLHFVSLFGPDNKPISVSKYKDAQSMLPQGEFFNIQEIEKPPGSKMIVFQVYADECPVKFINEPRMLSGRAKLYLKVFEGLDCGVVLLPPKFFRLTPEAKEEFLKSEINEIFDESSESVKSTALKE